MQGEPGFFGPQGEPGLPGLPGTKVGGFVTPPVVVYLSLMWWLWFVVSLRYT